MNFQPGDVVNYWRTERDGGQTSTTAVVVEVDPSKKRVGIAVQSYEADLSTGRWSFIWEPKRVSPTSISKKTQE